MSTITWLTAQTIVAGFHTHSRRGASATICRNDPRARVERHSVFAGVRGERLSQALAGARCGGRIQPLQHVANAREATDPFERGSDVRTVEDGCVHLGE